MGGKQPWHKPYTPDSKGCGLKTCLKCGIQFHSQGSHNRICKRCKQKMGWKRIANEYWQINDGGLAGPNEDSGRAS